MLASACRFVDQDVVLTYSSGRHALSAVNKFNGYQVSDSLNYPPSSYSRDGGTWATVHFSLILINLY